MKMPKKEKNTTGEFQLFVRKGNDWRCTYIGTRAGCVAYATTRTWTQQMDEIRVIEPGESLPE